MSDTLKIASNLAIFTAHHERKIDIFYPAVHELGRLAAIEQAATALIKCKGRYHAEQNTKALAEALGIALPLPTSDHPAEQSRAEDLLVRALAALEYHTQQTRPITESENVIAALMAYLTNKCAEQAEDPDRPSAVELQAAEVGIPWPVTELINPAATEPLDRNQAMAWLVENIKGWPYGDNEAGWSVESCNGWEWKRAKGSWAFTSKAWVFINIQEWQTALLMK